MYSKDQFWHEVKQALAVVSIFIVVIAFIAVGGFLFAGIIGGAPLRSAICCFGFCLCAGVLVGLYDFGPGGSLVFGLIGGIATAAVISVKLTTYAVIFSPLAKAFVIFNIGVIAGLTLATFATLVYCIRAEIKQRKKVSAEADD